MVKTKLTGFLIVESIVALLITISGVVIMALIVGQSRALEQKMEEKTDCVYAWHVMKKCDLAQITVHSHVYQLVGNKKVYDTKDKKTYQITK